LLFHKPLTALVLSSSVFLAACAEKSQNVNATYVSPLAYQSYNCRQIEAEARRISSRTSQISGVQDNNANNDAVATGVALVLFWPAAFFIGGNKENAAELARLKGEMDAVEQASIQKQCGISFTQSSASE